MIVDGLIPVATPCPVKFSKLANYWMVFIEDSGSTWDVSCVWRVSYTVHEHWVQARIDVDRAAESVYRQACGSCDVSIVKCRRVVCLHHCFVVKIELRRWDYLFDREAYFEHERKQFDDFFSEVTVHDKRSVIWSAVKPVVRNNDQD